LCVVSYVIHSFIHFNSGSKAHKPETEAIKAHTNIQNTEKDRRETVQ